MACTRFLWRIQLDSCANVLSVSSGDTNRVDRMGVQGGILVHPRVSPESGIIYSWVSMSAAISDSMYLLGLYGDG